MGMEMRAIYDLCGRSLAALVKYKCLSGLVSLPCMSARSYDSHLVYKSGVVVGLVCSCHQTMRVCTAYSAYKDISCFSSIQKQYNHIVRNRKHCVFIHVTLLLYNL